MTIITVIIDDCLNEKNGIQNLKDNSIDLGITDPPWNISFDGATGSQGGKIKEYKGFIDKFSNYKEWCAEWFYHYKRVCKIVILACGRQNLKMWYRISDPDDIFFHFRKNGTFGSRIATFNNADVFLFYGITKRYFNSNVFYESASTYFLRKYPNLKHPSPKNFNVWKKIIEGINPNSVLDLFIGSGTTAEISKILGIKYCLGYEINTEYKEDILFRINQVNATKSGILHWLT